MLLLTYLVEVDVHALELELRSAVVTVQLSVPSRNRGQDQWAGNRRCIHAIAVEAVLARDGLPKNSRSVTMLRGRIVACRASRRWTWSSSRDAPESSTDLVTLGNVSATVAMIRSAGVDRSNLRIGRSEGEPKGEKKFTLAI